MSDRQRGGGGIVAEECRGLFRPTAEAIHRQLYEMGAEKDRFAPAICQLYINCFRETHMKNVF